MGYAKPSTKIDKELSGNRWPLSFRRLYDRFRSVNTHLTFISSHSRTTSPTIELIQKFNPDIKEIDLTIIANLLPPEDVFYGYLDENQISLSFAENLHFDWNKGYNLTSATTVNDVYEEAARLEKENSDKNLKQVLIFDFKDIKLHGIGAALKRRKIEEDSNQTFFLTTKELSVQNLSNSQLTNIIKTRNAKFKRILDDYLEKYTDIEISSDIPMKDLIEINKNNIPKPPDMSDPIEMAINLQHSRNSTSVKPDIDEMLNILKAKPFYRGQLAYSKTLDPYREAQYMPLEDAYEKLHPQLEEAILDAKGFSLNDGLYIHQAIALDKLLISDHQPLTHVIVSTSTSSGKSLIYQIPILNSILWDITEKKKGRNSTAFMIFPTKALAQDQKRHLQNLINKIPLNNERKIIVETYDGDTDYKSRSYIRCHADIVFTNPDAIHASIIPNHNLNEDNGWKDFLSNLKFVVMDELHVYKGTFGVHVSFVMARLRRIASIYNKKTCPIKFVSCSATIKDPLKHFRAVCAIPNQDEVINIAVDGSPCAERKLVIWNPPPLMNKKGRTQAVGENNNKSSKSVNDFAVPRESIILELAKVLLQLLTNFQNIKVIVFCPIRKICEMLMKEIRALLKSNTYQNKTNLNEYDIMAYRGGYSKHDRRIIESKMFKGELRAIIATNALELGIDLSDLDVVISCGFPMLKLNLHQQFGRAGRAKDSKGSLALFIAGSTPIDQHYLNNPLELCDRSNYEDLCVNGLIDSSPNKLIMEMHLQCAAFEKPIDIEDDAIWFVPGLKSTGTEEFIKLCQERLYYNVDRNEYCTNPSYLPWPAERVPIRAVEETDYAVVDITKNRNVVIEEIPASRTSFTLYEGGIYLHQGFPYLVKEFNPEKQYAKVERVNVDWITQQRDFTDIDPIEIECIKQLHLPNYKASDIPVFYGKIETTIIVFGFFKVSRSSEILEAVDVKNPPIKFISKGFWIDIPVKALNLIKEKKLSSAGGIHAAQHSIMNMLPLFISGGATTNPNVRFSSSVGEAELITECKAPQKEFAQRQTKRKRPARLIFYDSKGGAQGSGISSKAFEHIDQILLSSYNRVKNCACLWGCPECVTASFCKEMLLVISKPAAIIILASLLDMDINTIGKSLPDGPEENMPDIKVDTIEATTGLVKFSKDINIIEI